MVSAGPSGEGFSDAESVVGNTPSAQEGHLDRLEGVLPIDRIAKYVETHTPNCIIAQTDNVEGHLANVAHGRTNRHHDL